jgi:hypothetical protein
MDAATASRFRVNSIQGMFRSNPKSVFVGVTSISSTCMKAEKVAFRIFVKYEVLLPSTVKSLLVFQIARAVFQQY